MTARMLLAGSCDELDKIKTSVLIVDCQYHVSGVTKQREVLWTQLALQH